MRARHGFFAALLLSCWIAAPQTGPVVVAGLQVHKFGFAVAGAGDVNGDGYDDVIVGAFEAGAGGMAFVYHGAPNGPADEADWSASAGQAGASFGFVVAGAGDVDHDGYDDVIVGAPFYDREITGGRAFLYHGSPTGLSAEPDAFVAGDQAGSFFGVVSGAGDVNGDGFDDVIVGAPGWDGLARESVGKVFVFHGSADGLSTTPARTWEGAVEGARMGASVAAAGDVDRNGYDDILYGVPFDNQDGNGLIEVRLGSPDGLLGGLVRGSPSGTPTEFGAAVTGVGDVNGDGYADIAVGDPSRAEVHLYHGPTLGLDVYEPDHTYDLPSIGPSVAGAGDVNGDGFAEMAFGAPYRSPADRGGADLVVGSAAGASSTPGWTVAGQDYSLLGISVAGAGDVNGDGYDDVIVGRCPSCSGGTAAQGSARIYYGSHGGLDETPGWTAFGEPPRAIGEVVSELVVSRTPSGIALTWGLDTCPAQFLDFAVYEGSLGDFDSHVPRSCRLFYDNTLRFTPASGNRYFLVVSQDGASEGSHGRASDGVERSQGQQPCFPQRIAPCE